MTEKTLQDAYDEGEFVDAPEPTREQVLLQALTDIGRLVFEVPEGERVEIDLRDLVQGVSQLVQSEKRLRKALKRLLDARVGGTIGQQAKAQEKGSEALSEGFAAQREAGRALNPDAGHGAADGFGGSDFD